MYFYLYLNLERNYFLPNSDFKRCHDLLWVQSFSIHDMNVGSHVMFSSLNSFLETYGILNVSISFSLNFSAFKIFYWNVKYSNIFNRVNFIYYIFLSLNFNCCVVYVLPSLYLGGFILLFPLVPKKKRYNLYSEAKVGNQNFYL